MKIINFITGFLIGALLVLGIFLSHTKTEILQPQENISLAPRELPKDEIEYDEIKIPTNLREVIL